MGEERKKDAAEAEAALARARALLATRGPLDERARSEALEALDELALALGPAIRGAPAEARSAAHFTEALAHEATTPSPSRSVIGAAIEGLNGAVERLEATHPVMGLVERLSQALGQLGI